MLQFVAGGATFLLLQAWTTPERVVFIAAVLVVAVWIRLANEHVLSRRDRATAEERWRAWS